MEPGEYADRCSDDACDGEADRSSAELEAAAGVGDAEPVVSLAAMIGREG